MNRTQYFVLLMAVLLTSCQMGAASPTATAVPPSDTPAPTDTPLPTDTATPVPTSTPDAAATAAAQATAGAASVLDELDRLLAESDVPYQDGHLAWQQTEPLAINMQGPSGTTASILEIDEDLSAGNFVLKSDVTWEATGWMYCGAVFRSEPNIQKGKQYQFYFLRFSGLPIWYLDVYQNGSDYLGTISKEQTSSDIDMSNGAVNQFVVVAEGEKFTVYFNGNRQGRFFDNSKQRMEGYFGFFGWQESGTGSCKFNNSWVWSLDK
jgi:hypothetical protein